MAPPFPCFSSNPSSFLLHFVVFVKLALYFVVIHVILPLPPPLFSSALLLLLFFSLLVVVLLPCCCCCASAISSKFRTPFQVPARANGNVQIDNKQRWQKMRKLLHNNNNKNNKRRKRSKRDKAVRGRGAVGEEGSRRETRRECLLYF